MRTGEAILSANASEDSRFVSSESLAGLAPILGFLAIVFATVNVVGGFLVTDRMLKMFRKR